MANHFRSRHGNLAVAAGIVTLATTSTVAWAEDAPTGSAVLEEVIITATKTEESQQKVPVSVTALSGDSLRSQVVLNVQDLAEHVPGLVVSPASQGGAPSFAIRSSKQDGGSSGGVAVYVDDMPIFSTYAIADSVYDLNSVAVLKGPQGTLFGVNTTGGAIIFRPNKPTKNFEAYVDVGAGNYNRHEAEAMINLPVSDVLQVRFAGNYVRRDGFVTNLTPVPGRIDDKLSDDNHESGRLSVRLLPTDNLINDLVADYYHSDGSQRVPTITEFVPASTLTAANIRGRDTISLGGNPSGINLPNFSKNEMWGVYDTLTYAFSDNASIKNTLGYRKDHADAFDDNDGTNIDLVNGHNEHKAKLLVEELSVHLSNEMLRYSGGLYYSKLEREDGTAYTLAQNFFLLGFVPGVPAGTPIAQQANSYYTRDFTSKALYSQVDINLSQELTLTLGGRYTWDEGDYSAQNRQTAGLPDPTGSFFLGPCNTSGTSNLPGGYNPATCTGYSSAKWSAPSFNAALTSQFSDKSMAYFKVAGGYQAGGFNNQIREAAFQTFDPEKAVEFEAGMKSDWELFGRPIRTNIDGFYGNTQNKQEVQNGQYFDPPASRPSFTAVFNAGSLTYYGLDLEASYVLTDSIKLNAAWNHIEAQYDNFDFPTVGATPGRDLANTQPAQVPKDTITASLDVTWPLPSAVGTVSSVMTYYFRSKIAFADVPNTTGPFGSFSADSNIGEAYSTSNFTTDWKGIFGTNLDAGVWVKNVFDKDYAIYKTPQAALGYASIVFGDPRTYGARLRYSF